MFRLLSIIFVSIACSTSFAKKEAAKTRVNLDTTASVINWKGTKAFVGDHHVGTVQISSGTLFVENDQITGGEITVDMTSIKNTDVTDASMNGKLVGHLKNDDFFAVDKNKTAMFMIKSVKLAADGTHEMTGEAMIRGTKQPMTIKALIKKENGIWVATGKTEFDRTKFGVKYNSKDFFPDMLKSAKDKVIKNEIELDFNLKTKAM